MGAGPTGLLLAGLISAAGARVDVIERRAERLAVATRFGADRCATDTNDLEQNSGWHVVVDATGSAAAMQHGLSLVRKAGRSGVFGVASADAIVALSPYDVFSRNVFPADDLLADPVPLSDIGVALQRTRDGAGLKTTVAPNATPIAAHSNGAHS